MKISRLASDGDWTFGRGLANYATARDALEENLITRLKSFANDWFLDVDANIDWIGILGVKNNRTIIINEVSRVVTETPNVLKLNSIEFSGEGDTKRHIQLFINVSTIYDNELFLTADI